MSKAFTKEEVPDDPIIVRHRAPLPAGEPNYVTERGLQLLRSELEVLEQERTEAERATDEGPSRLPALTLRIADLAGRIGSALVPDGRALASDEVRFGATVIVRGGDGAEHCYQIVGVDEADARHGRIAFAAPIARALLGKRVGEMAVVRTPRGEEELEILSIAAPGEAGAAAR